jgi:hypothetical protein
MSRSMFTASVSRGSSCSPAGSLWSWGLVISSPPLALSGGSSQAEGGGTPNPSAEQSAQREKRDPCGSRSLRWGGPGISRKSDFNRDQPSSDVASSMIGIGDLVAAGLKLAGLGMSERRRAATVSRSRCRAAAAARHRNGDESGEIEIAHGARLPRFLAYYSPQAPRAPNIDNA